MLKNLIMFKAGWLACVLGAANGHAWIGAAAVALIAAEHLRTASAPSREGLLLAAAGIVGLAWESLLVSLGMLEYNSGLLTPMLAPYWIVAMWVLFATTLNIGLKWVKRHWLIAALAGAVGGPLAFLGGERLGAVVFPDPTLSLLTIGLGWALLLPLLALVAQHYDGHTPNPVRVTGTRMGAVTEL
jgi:hypothetical protein